MTKSAQIMKLYDGKRSTREIAEIVGCLPEYVRIVARQRKGKGRSEVDDRYHHSEKGAARQQRVIKQWHATPKHIRRKARSEAYHEARKAGLSWRDASNVSMTAVRRAVREYHNQKKRRTRQC